jgi:alcohol dehydrogenase class IV
MDWRQVFGLVMSIYLPKVKELGEALNVEVKGDSAEAALAKVVEKIRLLQHKVGLPADFTQYNITEENLAQTVPAVMKDPAALSFPMPKELIEAIGQRVVPLGVK